MDHPNIVKLYEVFEDSAYLYLVMELCRGGHLCGLILNGKPFTETQVATTMRQILRAVAYLHSNCICHRDLKPENCLLTSGSIGSNNLRVVDFGVSCNFNPGEKLTKQVGTMNYMAPEVLKEAPREYDNSCDIWSCGAIMYFLFSGELAFSGNEIKPLRARVSSGKLPFKPAKR